MRLVLACFVPFVLHAISSKAFPVQLTHFELTIDMGLDSIAYAFEDTYRTNCIIWTEHIHSYTDTQQSMQ